MTYLTEDEIEELLKPFIDRRNIPRDLYAQLSVYLDLLMRWSKKTNLTAVREPREMVRRHFGESLFLGMHLPRAHTLLDYGSGAGFPGLPIQLLLPGLNVTLAESQGKKSGFLREAVRVLGLKTEVWPHRVESMLSERRFDIVALRAVDKMEEATRVAASRVAEGGTLALLVAGNPNGIPIPCSEQGVIRLLRQGTFHVEQ